MANDIKYTLFRLVWGIDRVEDANDYILNGRDLLEDECLFESDDYSKVVLEMESFITFGDHQYALRFKDAGHRRIMVEYRLEKLREICPGDEEFLDLMDGSEQCYLFTEEGVKDVEHRG